MCISLKNWHKYLMRIIYILLLSFFILFSPILYSFSFLYSCMKIIKILSFILRFRT